MHKPRWIIFWHSHIRDTATFSEEELCFWKWFYILSEKGSILKRKNCPTHWYFPVWPKDRKSQKTPDQEFEINIAFHCDSLRNFNHLLLISEWVILLLLCRFRAFIQIICIEPKERIIVQLLPLCEGNMKIYSPEAGYVTWWFVRV